MPELRLCSLRFRLSSLAILFASTAVPAPAMQETVRFQLKPSGFAERIGMYTPVGVKLTKEKPASIQKLPVDFAATHFGVLPFVGRSGQGLAVALSEPVGGEARLLVDANANGDLSDDPQAEWKSKSGKSSTDNRDVRNYSGHTDVVFSTSNSAPKVRLGLYRFDPADPARAAEREQLFVYSDYGYEGLVSVGSAKMRAALSDEAASGSFQIPRTVPAPSTFMLIDTNADGTFDRASERFDAAKPLAIGGGEFVVSKMTAGGDEFVWATAKQPPAAPTAQAGLGQAKTFEATSTSGQKINFPTDYKGKLVLLDFWATWCRPCMIEMPNVVAASNKFRERGLEVLGISLDSPQQLEALKKTVEAQKMNWPQIHDGKGWKSNFVGLYEVRAIPRAFLVDGSTGEILATGSDLRGPNLHNTIEAALKRRASNPLPTPATK